MKTLLLTTALIIFFKPSIGQPVSTQNIEDMAREIAIDNFAKCKLGKNYMAFSVTICKNSKYSHYKINEDIIVISILPQESIEYNIGIYDTIGSSRLGIGYVVKGDKLFYWSDSTCILTAQAISDFQKYKLAKVVYVDASTISGIWYTNDRLKAAQYYFCRDNPKHYKRVITWIGVGGYKPPRLRCGK